MHIPTITKNTAKNPVKNDGRIRPIHAPTAIVPSAPKSSILTSKSNKGAIIAQNLIGDK